MSLVALNFQLFLGTVFLFDCGICQEPFLQITDFGQA